MKTIVNKWNDKKHCYEPEEIPAGWKVKFYSDRMEEKINCVNCGKPITYGESYCSKRYHTAMGMGYSECEDCYLSYLKKRLEG